jgi:hypothetical protein
MVAVFLGESTAFPERTEPTSMFPGDVGAKEHTEPVAALAI